MIVIISREFLKVTMKSFAHFLLVLKQFYFYFSFIQITKPTFEMSITDFNMQSNDYGRVSYETYSKSSAI